jgi:hypothetical protein
MDYTECHTFAASLVERAKNTMKADGHLIPILFAIDQAGHMKTVQLKGGPNVEIADLARAAVKEEHAYAAVVANEATFSELYKGEVQREYTFDAIAIACVHPDGHAVWLTQYAREHGITFGKTMLLEGEAFSGPITEILK